MRWVTFLAALLVAVACGERKTDVRTRSGSIAFAGTIAYFFRSSGTLPPVLGSTPIDTLLVEIHESADGCGPWLGVVPPTRSVVSVTVARPESTSITPDRYPIAQTVGIDQGWVTYDHQDPAGQIMYPGISGAVDLDRLSDTAAQGLLDVTLIDGTRIQGEFAAVPCS